VPAAAACAITLKRLPTGALENRSFTSARRIRYGACIGGTMGKPAKPAAKTFSLHWGSGIIEEEAQCVTPFHRPTVQLLKFTAGEAAGSYEIRFCHYDHRGRFQRAPLIIEETDIPALKRALADTPKLRKLLAKLVTG
jgi:hypothetical protein